MTPSSQVCEEASVLPAASAQAECSEAEAVPSAEKKAPAASKASLWMRIAQLASAYEVEGGASRIVPMEGLRGLAVLLVFFVHYDALFGMKLNPHSWLFRIFEFLGTVGNAGVDLFFVMSGYLIYSALIRRQVDYLKFSKRRVQRIYPAFTVVLLLYLALSVVFPEANKIHAAGFRAGLYILANFLLLPGIFTIQPIITVAWSLSYEFFFYLSLPALIWAAGMRRWRASRRLIAFVLLWVFFGAVSFYLGPENRIRMISFITGIILYELVSMGKIRPALARWGEAATVIGVMASFAFFYVVHRPRSQSQINVFLPVFALSVAFFFLSLYSFEQRGTLQKVFSWSPARYLGNMSYSYYLIHGLALEGVAKLVGAAGLPLASPWVALPSLVLGFAATWMTASALFFLVEKRYSLAAKAHSPRRAWKGSPAEQAAR